MVLIQGNKLKDAIDTRLSEKVLPIMEYKPKGKARDT